MEREKRRIEDVIDELGIVVDYKDMADRPYYVGLCPFHDDTNASFAVWPKVQRWKCFTCAPEGGDVIDLYRRMFDLTFSEAKKRATVEISDEDAFKRKLSVAEIDFVVDMPFLLSRIEKISDSPRRMDFDDMQVFLHRIDNLLVDNRWREVDKMLRDNGL